MIRGTQSPARVIAALKEGLLLGGCLSTEDAQRLMRLCHHPEELVREAAHLLLLHPPVDQDLDHCVALLSTHLKGPLGLGRIPLALFELALDLVAALRGFPGTPDLRSSIERLLTRAPRAAARLPAGGRLSLDEIGVRIARRMISAQCGKRAGAFIPKVRLLLRQRPSKPPAWAVLTTAELSPLWENPRDRSRQRITRGRWLRVGRALNAPAVAEDREPVRPHPSHFQPAYWGGYGRASLRYLEGIFEMQAREVAAQKELCDRVSAATGRVVLSLHNASLAAMGGWGFESLQEAMPEASRRRSFLNGVRLEATRIRRETSHDSELDAIERLRFDRIIRPKLTQVLIDADIRSRLDPCRPSDSERAIREVLRRVGDDSATLLVKRGPYGVPGAVAPHQRLDLGPLLRWSARPRGLWKAGLVRLAALLSHAQDAMSRGEIGTFTLPWIDKFYISSRRDRDGAYLPAVVQWLRARGARPIVLFWEDTAHAERPSFRLALDTMIAQGMAFRGIGIFDPSGSDRGDAERIIVSTHSSVDLFALRPWTDKHWARSFHQLLRTLDPGLLRTYDSSWKDNLAFIYAGTQVSWLLSPQTSMESFSPWVLVEGRKHPFGAFLRGVIRRRILGTMPAPRDDLWVLHTKWAHLT